MIPHVTAVVIVTITANRRTTGSKATVSSRGSASRPSVFRMRTPSVARASPSHSAERGEYQGFNHELPGETGPAGAERRPDGELLHSARCADQNQVGHVDTRHQKHQRNGKEQEEDEIP